MILERICIIYCSYRPDALNLIKLYLRLVTPLRFSLAYHVVFIVDSTCLTLTSSRFEVFRQFLCMNKMCLNYPHRPTIAHMNARDLLSTQSLRN